MLLIANLINPRQHMVDQMKVFFFWFFFVFSWWFLGRKVKEGEGKKAHTGPMKEFSGEIKEMWKRGNL